MSKDESKKALVEATDKLAEQASKDGPEAEKAKDERSEAEKKLTGADQQKKH